MRPHGRFPPPGGVGHAGPAREPVPLRVVVGVGRRVVLIAPIKPLGRHRLSSSAALIESWLRGSGAAAINNLMEDAATAEISRAQVWQWVRHGVRLREGQPVTRELVRQVQGEELQRLRQAWGEALVAKSRLDEAAHLFEAMALADEFPEFLTLPAYNLLP